MKQKRLNMCMYTVMFVVGIFYTNTVMIMNESGVVCIAILLIICQKTNTSKTQPSSALLSATSDIRYHVIS